MRKFIFVLLLLPSALLATNVLAVDQDKHKGFSCYIKGENVCALKEFIPAAEAGDVNAQYFIGDIYNKGTGGVKQDKTEALKWFEMAAKNGHRHAVKVVSTLKSELKEVTKKVEVANVETSMKNIEGAMKADLAQSSEAIKAINTGADKKIDTLKKIDASKKVEMVKIAE